jgi:hypothetical protein
MSFNYITLGYDCSPAGASRNLGLRSTAYPFDWVISSISALESCFATNFEYFHKNLVLNDTNTRMIDHYGFVFPHDYPFTETNNNEQEVGEGKFGEENGKIIINNWMEYHQIVLDKYTRRIERFKNIMLDPTPIIILCRYNTASVLELYNLIVKYYNRTNVYIVNASSEPFENNNIINIDTEKNNIWSEFTIWKEGIDYMIKNKL